MSTPAPDPLPDTTPGARSYAPDFLLEMFHNPLDAGYADAAARRARAGPPKPPAQRSGFVLRTVALVATGVLLAVAYQQTVAAQPESSKVRAGLVVDVQQRQADTDKLQRTADGLRAQVSKLRDAALVGSQVQALRDQEAATGLGAVTGAGLTVTLADGPTPTDPVTGKPLSDTQGKIVDYDLQIITNELWLVGAEAIAINGARLTATSSIRAAGSAILVNLEPLQQPYRITAIGPAGMVDQLNSSDVGAEYRYLATTYGVRFTVSRQRNLLLPAASDPQLRYARVIPPAPSASPPGAKSGSPSGSPSPSGTASSASPTGGR